MHLHGRIDAFARVQASLTRDPTAGVDLEMLVAEELLAHAADERKKVTSLTGPTVRLQPKAAETLALAFHELVTNALKYGALSVTKGRLKVGWRIEKAKDGSRLLIDWTEAGVSLSGDQPERIGFGLELLQRTLAYDLRGEAQLRFERDGLRCEISLPFDSSSFLLDERPMPT